MSEENIEKWQKAVTPERDMSKPWDIGSGGSWDKTEPLPIPDEMLAELAVMYRRLGCPWNCRTTPLSDADREYMYLLYYSMQGMVARIRKNEREIEDLKVHLQSYKGMVLDYAEKMKFIQRAHEAVPKFTGYPNPAPAHVADIAHEWIENLLASVKK